MKRNDKVTSWHKAMAMNWRAFLIYLRNYPQMVISSLLSVIWEALTPYVGIYFSALIIDELAGGRDQERLKWLVLLTLGSAALIALVSAFLNKWKQTHKAGQFYKVDSFMLQKLLSMDFINCDDTKTTDLMYTIYQNLSGGWGLYRVIESYEKLCNSIITILGGITLTISLFVSKVPTSAGQLTILNHPLSMLTVVVVMLAVTFIAPALENKAGSYWAKNAGVHNLGNRMFGFFGFLGHKKELAADMRLYRQDIICEKHNRNKEDTFSSKGLFARLSRGPMGVYRAASAAVSVTFTGIVYAFVCLKALAGAISLGAATQYVVSITKVSTGISGFVSTLGLMRNNAPFIGQVFEFLDIPNSMYQGSLTVEKRSDCKYEVEFRDVSFKYPGNDNYALRHVNMKFEVGKRLAVVGMNGSGKTTFIKLLCRLYDTTEGEILLNGIDIRKYNYREYMNVFSIVFQDFQLLALKLGENVASQVHYDRKKVINCLNRSGFSEKLANMEYGLDTYLYKDYDDDGVDISGGEAQKIAIARSLYKDASFMILDEPTAALDPIAEAEIYSKFDQIVGDKTAIYISHRLSSCKFCDQIAVFHEGSIVQRGTHDDLVADENGKYYELWHAQAQYYVENPIK